MSRIGKEPVALLAGVTVTVDGQKVTVDANIGDEASCLAPSPPPRLPMR